MKNNKDKNIVGSTKSQTFNIENKLKKQSASKSLHDPNNKNPPPGQTLSSNDFSKKLIIEENEEEKIDKTTTDEKKKNISRTFARNFDSNKRNLIPNKTENEQNKKTTNKIQNNSSNNINEDELTKNKNIEDQSEKILTENKKQYLSAIQEIFNTCLLQENNKAIEKILFKKTDLDEIKEFSNGLESKSKNSKYKVNAKFKENINKSIEILLSLNESISKVPIEKIDFENYKINFHDKAEFEKMISDFSENISGYFKVIIDFANETSGQVKNLLELFRNHFSEISLQIEEEKKNAEVFQNNNSVISKLLDDEKKKNSSLEKEVSELKYELEKKTNEIEKLTKQFKEKSGYKQFNEIIKTIQDELSEANKMRVKYENILKQIELKDKNTESGRFNNHIKQLEKNYSYVECDSIGIILDKHIKDNEKLRNYLEQMVIAGVDKLG